MYSKATQLGYLKMAVGASIARFEIKCSFARAINVRSVEYLVLKLTFDARAAYGSSLLSTILSSFHYGAYTLCNSDISLIIT